MKVRVTVTRGVGTPKERRPMSYVMSPERGDRVEVFQDMDLPVLLRGKLTSRRVRIITVKVEPLVETLCEEGGDG